MGGLSIFLSLKKMLPNENFLYLADQKNCPYGSKREFQIKKLSFQNTKFLVSKNCKLIVIACNTATTLAIDYLRTKLPQLVFIGVVPPLKPASRTTKTGHILLLSTRATQKSRYLKKLINDFASNKIVYNISCSGLVELIERGETKGMKIKKLLKNFLKTALQDKKIDVVITGCTHYYFIKKSLINLLGNKLTFIDPNSAVGCQVRRVLRCKKLFCRKRNKDLFFTTGNPLLFEKSFEKLMGFKIKAKKIKMV